MTCIPERTRLLYLASDTSVICGLVGLVMLECFALIDIQKQVLQALSLSNTGAFIMYTLVVLSVPEYRRSRRWITLGCLSILFLALVLEGWYQCRSL
jgi:hypothetical protein